ncbi:hypothetical protein LDO52_08135 [Acinetobacter pseudolwoffii]|uniref:hypothetical protein n=1 Tax=Acinetobacter pseudolwoffii TaxID=2053287 RepID=UPI001CE08548|nr:hypothetical protein [Acinetobacter pseudolwoffii]UBX51336.1 hypothetical protein LDO52_08135 [Acinetobacter pseudolwoffii]
MKKQLTLAALLAASLALTACAKQESAPAAEAEGSAAVATETVTPEQQAAIDAIDQPVLDEKNTDIPAEIANAPADAATADASVAATSEPVAP